MPHPVKYPALPIRYSFYSESSDGRDTFIMSQSRNPTSFVYVPKAPVMAVNLQTAWLSPPVALSAYFLKGVVPEWDLKDIYLGMMQFMVIQVIGLILIFVFPQIALWLPTLIYGE